MAPMATPMAQPTPMPTISDIPAAVSGQNTDQGWANWGASRLYDALMGVGLVGGGISDLVSAVPIAGARALGADIPYFPASKFIGEQAVPAGEKIGLQPSAALQEALSFLYPVGAGAKIPQVLAGAGAYAGKEAVEAVGGGPLSGIGGALAGSLGVSAALKAAPLGKLLLGTEGAIQQAAEQKVLPLMSEQGKETLAQAIAADQLTGVGGRQLTLAELVQEPVVASGQIATGQTAPGGKILSEVLKTSKEKLDNALESIGVDVNDTVTQNNLAIALNEAEKARVAEQAFSPGDFGTVPQTGELGLALSKKAEQAGQEAAQQIEEAARQLGLSTTVEKATPFEVGTNVRDALTSSRNAAKRTYKDAWEKVDKTAPLDLSTPLEKAKEVLDQFQPADLERNATLQKAVRFINKLTTADEAGNIPEATIGDLQQLYRYMYVAGRYADNTKNAPLIAQTTAVKKILDNLDLSNIGVPTGRELINLEAARAATRNFHETFSQGVVGKIVSTKGGEFKLAAQNIANKVLKTADSTVELASKFSEQHPAVIATRNELLNRLYKANNPQKFYADNRTQFEALFKGDASAVAELAAKKGAKTDFQIYQDITDSAIPKTVFANVDTIKTFVRQFKGTPIYDMGRGKFLDDLIKKKGSLVEALRQRDAQVKELFAEDYDKIYAIAAAQDANKPLKLKQILNDPQAAKIAAISYADDEIADWLKHIFGKDIVKSGQRSALTGGRIGAAEALRQRYDVAEAILGPEKAADAAVIYKDLDTYLNVDTLGRQAAKGNSATTLWRTALGALKNPGQFLTFLNQASNALKHGGAYVTASNALSLKGAETVKGMILSTAGMIGSKLTQKRIDQIEAATAHIFANPKLLEASLKAPTPENVNALFEMLKSAGIVSAKATASENVSALLNTATDAGIITAKAGATAKRDQEQAQPTPTAPASNSTIDDLMNQISSLGISEAGAEMLPPRAPTPAPEPKTIALTNAKTGDKLDVALPQGAKYAPANVVRAVIDIESKGRFNVSGPSTKYGRARGPMQLMPKTAEMLGINIDDPADNIAGGALYLKQMEQRFGSWPLALAAYNWGPGNISRNIRQLKNRDLAITWENLVKHTSIPRETREYVMKAKKLGVA
jgi:soluble lytic murein transglycosylase-like protein